MLALHTWTLDTTPLADVLRLARHVGWDDAYHLWRSGATLRDLEDVGPDEIAHVQFSDVPRGGLEPGTPTDRLPPGQGLVPFAEFFALLRSKGYRGPLSYEAPNPVAWARPAEAVLREALEATRARLPAST